MDSNFWKNKKVLLTGHTGFKGSWLSLWLQKLDVDLIGYSKSVPTKPSLFELANVEERMTSVMGDVITYYGKGKESSVIIFTSTKHEANDILL